MARPSSYPKELRDRAVRMVAEVRPSYEAEFEAIRVVAQVLHIMAIVQLRNDTDGRACYRRELAAGKPAMEAIRA